MTIEPLLLSSTSAPPNWPCWLEIMKGNIYHSLPWAETNRSQHSRPLFFHWLDRSGRCLGIAVGIETWSRMRYIGRFSKRLAFETYPAVCAGASNSAGAMIRQIMHFTKSHGYRSLSIQSFDAPFMVPDLEQIGFASTPRIEFVLDLTLPDDMLWQQCTEHHRRKIRRARQHGLRFEEFCTLDAIQQLHDLQVCSYTRRVCRGEDISSIDDKCIKELIANYLKKNFGRVFLMTQNGKPISGAFVTMYAGRAYYVYGGSSDDGFHMDAPAVLFWNIFSRSRELGCKAFNLGGVPTAAANPDGQSYGLYRFKSGFGGRTIHCLSGHAENIIPFSGALLKIAEKGRRLWMSA